MELKGLKVGDEVAIHSWGWDSDWTPCTVTRITPKGQISVSIGSKKFQLKSGKEIGDSGGYYGCSLVRLTDEVRTSMAERNAEKEWKALVRKVCDYRWRDEDGATRKAAIVHFRALAVIAAKNMEEIQ